MDGETFIYNALNKEVSVKAFGNHFRLKPKQIKRMSKDIGDFLVKEKGYMGIVDLPLEFEDPNYQSTEEGQALLQAKTEEGINKRIRHLEWVVHNETVSLRQDLDQANIKADVKSFMSNGGVNAMEELVDYQRAAEDKNKQRLEHIRSLERKLQSNSNSLVNKDK